MHAKVIFVDSPVVLHKENIPAVANDLHRHWFSYIPDWMWNMAINKFLDRMSPDDEIVFRKKTYPDYEGAD